MCLSGAALPRTSPMTRARRRPHARPLIVGDYLWPADKTAKPADDANDDDGDAKPIEHEKKKPVAEAASDEDIKNAIGDEDAKTETTSPTDPAAEKKTDAPKVEKMDKPTVEEIE